MERLIDKAIVSIVVISLIIYSCNSHSAEFLYLDDILMSDSDSSQQHSDLIGFLYLKPDLVDSVKVLYPKLLTKRQCEPGFFLIEKEDQYKIDLKKEYANVEEVIDNLSPELILFLQNKIGISNPREGLNKRIPIHERTAFVEFFGSASVHALVFDLKEKSKLTVGIAYIIVQ
jgi:hypothetical protein